MSPTSKPPPPPKPEHLAASCTGTLNSQSLRDYVKLQAQRTGGSISSFTSGDKEGGWAASLRVANKTPLGSVQVQAPVQGSSSHSDTVRITRRRDVASEDEETVEYATARTAVLKQIPTQKTAAAVAESPMGQEQDAEEEEDDCPTQKPVKQANNGHAPLRTLFQDAPPLPSETSSSNLTVEQWLQGTNHDQDDADADELDGARASGTRRSQRKRIPSNSSSVSEVSLVHSARTSIVSVAAAGTTELSSSTAQMQIVLKNGQGFDLATPPPELALPSSPPAAAAAAEAEAEAPTIALIADDLWTSAPLSAAAAALSAPLPAAPPPAPPSASATPRGRPARALFDIKGEAAFNELSLRAGQSFEVLHEGLAGGWAFAVVRAPGEAEAAGADLQRGTRQQDQHGLVPNGWYCFVQEFSQSPTAAAFPSSSAPAPQPPPQQQQLSPPASTDTVARLKQDSQQALSAFSSRVAHPLTRQSSQEPIRPIIDVQHAEGRSVILARGQTSEGTLPGAAHLTPAARPQSVRSASSKVLETVLQEAEAAREPIGPSPKPLGWLPGGKSLNRFGPLVSSGVESFLLRPDDAAASGLETPPLSQVQRHAELSAEGQHFVLGGSHGPRWKRRSPPFHVTVHSPRAVRKHVAATEYTLYSITSRFPSARSDALDERTEEQDEEEDGEHPPFDPAEEPTDIAASITVERRFNQFIWLATVLQHRYPALVLPTLPEKQYAGRFSPAFIEARRTELQRWLSRLVRHPVLQYDDAVHLFLSENDHSRWRKLAETMLSCSRAEDPAHFFLRAWHPEFNVDVQEATQDLDAMQAFHTANDRAMNAEWDLPRNLNGSSGILGAWSALREVHLSSSQAHAEFSYALLRLIQGTQAHDGDESASTSTSSLYGPPMGKVGCRSASGATNEQGAWCWREHCTSCSSLTKALQGTAECLQVIAEIQQEHAKLQMLRNHERLADVSRQQARHAVSTDPGTPIGWTSR